MQYCRVREVFCDFFLIDWRFCSKISHCELSVSLLSKESVGRSESPSWIDSSRASFTSPSILMDIRLGEWTAVSFSSLLEDFI